MPYNKGAMKAKNAMKKRYGARWKRVYYGRAMKYGKKGQRPHTKANSIYGKGAHRIKKVKAARRKKR